MATAITSSSAAPPWRSGWRLNCQPASAEVSPRPAADSRSTAAGRGRQQPQREHRAARQGERGGEHQHRIDGRRAARGRRDGRVPPQLPAGQYRQRDQRQVGPGPRRAGEHGLPAPADLGGAPSGTQHRVEERADREHGDGERRVRARRARCPRRSGRCRPRGRGRPCSSGRGCCRAAGPARSRRPRRPAPVTSDSGITSAAVSLVSCHLVAPRAVSSAVSPSRWAASSRATASSAATVSTSSSSALIAEQRPGDGDVVAGGGEHGRQVGGQGEAAEQVAGADHARAGRRWRTGGWR